MGEPPGVRDSGCLRGSLVRSRTSRCNCPGGRSCVLRARNRIRSPANGGCILRGLRISAGPGRRLFPILEADWPLTRFSPAFCFIRAGFCKLWGEPVRQRYLRPGPGTAAVTIVRVARSSAAPSGQRAVPWQAISSTTRRNARRRTRRRRLRHHRRLPRSRLRTEPAFGGWRLGRQDRRPVHQVPEAPSRRFRGPARLRGKRRQVAQVRLGEWRERLEARDRHQGLAPEGGEPEGWRSGPAAAGQAEGHRPSVRKDGHDRVGATPFLDRQRSGSRFMSDPLELGTAGRVVSGI